MPSGAAPRKRAIRKLSALRFTYPSTRAPEVLAAKGPSRRRLSLEYVQCGRQGENRQTSTSETVSAASAWATRAHAPAPAMARAMPTAPPITAPAIARSCKLRKRISRFSSATCVDETEVMRKRAEVAAKSGATAGVEKRSAMSGEAATPPPAHNVPAAIVVQKAVERSRSV